MSEHESSPPVDDERPFLPLEHDDAGPDDDDHGIDGLDELLPGSDVTCEVWRTKPVTYRGVRCKGFVVELPWPFSMAELASIAGGEEYELRFFSKRRKQRTQVASRTVEIAGPPRFPKLADEDYENPSTVSGEVLSTFHRQLQEVRSDVDREIQRIQRSGQTSTSDKLLQKLIDGFSASLQRDGLAGLLPQPPAPVTPPPAPLPSPAPQPDPVEQLRNLRKQLTEYAKFEQQARALMPTSARDEDEGDDIDDDDSTPTDLKGMLFELFKPVIQQQLQQGQLGALSNNQSAPAEEEAEPQEDLTVLTFAQAAQTDRGISILENIAAACATDPRPDPQQVGTELRHNLMRYGLRKVVETCVWEEFVTAIDVAAEHDARIADRSGRDWLRKAWNAFTGQVESPDAN